MIGSSGPSAPDGVEVAEVERVATKPIAVVVRPMRSPVPAETDSANLPPVPTSPEAGATVMSHAPTVPDHLELMWL